VVGCLADALAIPLGRMQVVPPLGSWDDAASLAWLNPAPRGSSGRRLVRHLNAGVLVQHGPDGFIRRFAFRKAMIESFTSFNARYFSGAGGV